MNVAKFNAMYDLLLELKTDVALLNTKYDKLASEFGSYTKRQSDIQEDSATLFIMRELSRYLKQYTIHKLDFKKIYMPDSNAEFTDFDGCIKLSKYNIEEDAKNLFNLNTRKQNIVEAKQKIQVPNFINKETDIALVIECKHGLTKENINAKLIQMYNFKNMVKKYKSGNITSQSNNFRKMAQEGKLINFPNVIYIVFSANDLSTDCVKYIEAINNGMDAKIYDDTIMPDLKKRCISVLQNEGIPNSLKSKLNKVKTSDEIYTILEKYPEYLKYVFNTILPYKSMQHIFEEFINKVGIHRFDEIIIPQIYQSTSFKPSNF